MSLISRRLALSSLAGLGLSAVGLGCNPSNSGTAASSTGVGGTASAGPKSYELLNVSYDPTRELWKQINAAFSKKFASSGQGEIQFRQSHGASGSQARAIIDGLEADVATLSLWPDTDALRKTKLLNDGWEERLPNHSVAYHSTVVFVVRKGNPKAIKTWDDLAKPGVQVITPSPKTSGNGRLSLLAAWGSVLENKGTEEDAKAFIAKLYGNVPVLDTGARGATTTFSQKKLGDVHLAMESEAWLEVEESSGELEIVYPPVSILHEPPVTVVDAVVEKKGTRAVAEEYLKFLYTPEGQEIIAKHHYRPTDPAVLAKNKDHFPEMKLLQITAVAKDWNDAQARFFEDGGIFDSIYSAPGKS